MNVELELNFGQDFEAKLWSMSWSWSLAKNSKLNLVENMEAEVWSWFWSLSSVKILKLKFGQESEVFSSRFVKDKLLIWLIRIVCHFISKNKDCSCVWSQQYHFGFFCPLWTFSPWCGEYQNDYNFLLICRPTCSDGANNEYFLNQK